MTAQDGRLRLLFVNDVPANTRVLMEMPQQEYDVMIADDGSSALKIAAENPLPDLILLDIVIAGMDGHEVCRNLKENEATRKIPVMLLTAFKENAFLSSLTDRLSGENTPG